MKRYWLLAFGMVVAFGALFGVAEALDLRFEPAFEQASVATGAIGIGLLIVDVLLPVPSSLIMTGHGAVFGWPVGAALSLIGAVLAAIVAFWIGRRGGALLERLVGADERARADAMLAKWGVLAIILTRPLPMLAETAALLAGASKMRWRTLILGATLGNLAPALLYAITGATAASLSNSFLIFGLVVGTSGLFWLAARGRPAP